MFRLKKGKEAFTVVEGPFKGRSFKPGQPYPEIPSGLAAMFEDDAKPAVAAKPAKADSKRLPSGPASEKVGGKS